MKAVVQRVKKCNVKVNNEIIGNINNGLLILLGVGEGDCENNAEYLADKIVNLRIFEDDDNKMNLSALDLEREIIIVSQFTLYGDCSRGRRPSFSGAAGPEKAEKLYNYFVKEIKNYGLKTETGQFKAMMDVELINDGPVTLVLDSHEV